MKPKFYLSLLLAMFVVGNVWAQEASLSKEERRALRLKQRAERIERFEANIDSIVLTHQFVFTPRTLQRQDGGRTRRIVNPEFQVMMWDNRADICLPFVEGIVPPYRISVLNYTISDIKDYTLEKSRNGWTIKFTSSLYSSRDYTFLFEVFRKTGSATLTLSNGVYSPIIYDGAISEIN